MAITCAAARLLLLAAWGAVPHAAGVRVESQDLINEVMTADTGARAGHVAKEEEEKAFESSSSRSSSAAHVTTRVSSKKVGGTITEQQCLQAVSSSFKRSTRWVNLRLKKCECAEGQVVTCPHEVCHKFGRYFRPKEFQGRGCHCAHCLRECGDIVTGAKKTQFGSLIRGFHKECMCEKGHVVGGEAGLCKTSGRYFAVEDLRDQDCHCTPKLKGQEEGVKSNSSRPPAPPANTVQPMDTEEVPTTTTDPNGATRLVASAVAGGLQLLVVGLATMQFGQ